MNPNAYLRGYWRLEMKPQVCVAVPANERVSRRWDSIFRPAIEALAVGDQRFAPVRLALSPSDATSTAQLMDNVAHSDLVLVDASVVGAFRATGESFRDENVMYVLGLALACRQPCEVVIVRDDKQRCLFDSAGVAQKTVNFKDTEAAIEEIRHTLAERMAERKYLDDARIKTAVQSLDIGEIQVLDSIAKHAPGDAWGFPPGQLIPLPHLEGVRRLLDKQLITLVGKFANDQVAYACTRFGYSVAQQIGVGLPVIGEQRGTRATERTGE